MHNSDLFFFRLVSNLQILAILLILGINGTRRSPNSEIPCMKQQLIPEAYAVYPLLVLHDVDKAWQYPPLMKCMSLFLSGFYFVSARCINHS